jgi:type IV pilus assembly protein PilY1
MKYANPLMYRLGAALLGVLLSTAAIADDSEIFFGTNNSAATPNILFILDTSGSMGSTVTSQVPYDATVAYPGTCSSTLVYYANSTGTPTGCGGTMKSFAATLQKCQQAATALATGIGAKGPGYFSGTFVQWRLSAGNYAWNASLGSSTSRFDVACLDDYSAGLGPYPSTYNGTVNSAANEWTATRANSYFAPPGGGGTGGLGGTGVVFTVYSGNYLNYEASNPPTTLGTRISVVQQAATNLINSLSNVNVGLMRYSDNSGGSNDTAASGGMVAYPISPVAVGNNRTDLINTVNSYSPSGWTPLSETLYEAYLYYSGGKVDFGLNSKPFASVPASRVATDQTLYKSPILYECQKNYIIYLTDGLPTQDNEADTSSRILGLPNEPVLGGACDDTTGSPYNGLDALGIPIPGGWGPGPQAGKCMKAMAKYLFNSDMSSTMVGQQNVSLFAIGFGNDPALGAATTWLNSAAVAGGGRAYTAGDLTTLEGVFTNIVNNILQASTSFNAPTVPVNAFNRSANLNDLYFSVFQPSVNYHWPGNIKRYEFGNGAIVDANGTPAVDPSTGFFKNSAQSVWSLLPDGAKVSAGGAANQLPFWDPGTSPSRKVYTYVGANPGSPVDLTSSAAYAFVSTNAALSNTVLGLAATATAAQHDNVINFVRGEDVKDANGNGIVNENRFIMGDPMHGQPGVVVYGGTPGTPDVTDAAVYATENDGMLHAIDARTGKEMWSFVPQDLLATMSLVYSDASQPAKHYSLDGDVVVLKRDVNGDGVVDPSAGDRVIVYFGQGRGGSNYYAIDVTNKNAPQFMWSLTASQLPGIGQAWSTPQITRVSVSGASPAQNPQKLALIFAGGYDPAEEATSYVNPAVHVSSGNHIYMVDAYTGNTLWSAGPATSTTDNLKLTRMDHSIPSNVAVLDLNSDGYADRMYVGDMAGQLWRFDITNGNPAASLVAGGVIASLGTHDDATPGAIAANVRRFYAAPDVSSVAQRGISPFLNIAIGSGYRGHPTNLTVAETFYSVRDYAVDTPLTQTQYDNYVVLHDSDLVDVTNTLAPVLASGSPGWKLRLVQAAGEKSLSSSVTLGGTVYFPTYSPPPTSGVNSANPCNPGLGVNRAYAVSVFNAAPTNNLDNNTAGINTALTDRFMQLTQSGIAPSMSVLFIQPPVVPCTGVNCVNPPPGPPRPICTYAQEVTNMCANLGDKFKTYWREGDAN